MALGDVFEGAGEVIKELSPLPAQAGFARSLGSKTDL